MLLLPPLLVALLLLLPLLVALLLLLLLLLLVALVLLLLLLLALVVLVSRASEGARTKVALWAVARYDLAVARSAHVPRHVPTRSP